MRVFCCLILFCKIISCVVHETNCILYKKNLTGCDNITVKDNYPSTSSCNWEVCVRYAILASFELCIVLKTIYIWQYMLLEFMQKHPQQWKVRDGGPWWGGRVRCDTMREAVPRQGFESPLGHGCYCHL